MLANKANFNSIFLQRFLTHSFPQPEYQVFFRGWGREDSLSLFLSFLYYPFPQKRLRTQAIFFTMGCSSLLPKRVGERRFALSLSFSLLSSSLPQKRLRTQAIFSQWGSSLLPKGVGERRFALSLFFASLFLLTPETPQNSGYFFTMGLFSSS